MDDEEFEKIRRAIPGCIVTRGPGDLFLITEMESLFGTAPQVRCQYFACGGDLRLMASLAAKGD